MNIENAAGEQDGPAPDPTPASAGTPQQPPTPPPDPRITALAQSYPKGIELTQATRIEAYYAVGALLPKATIAGSRSTAYGKNPVNAFLTAWEAAGGMTLSSSALKLCRQVYGGYTAHQIADAIQAKILWTDLRALCQTRVTPQTRTKILAELCAGTLKPADVLTRIDLEGAGRPRKGRQPVNRVEALRHLYGETEALRQALAGAAGIIQKAVSKDAPSAEVVVDGISTSLKACLRRWHHELKSARRRREPETPGPVGSPPPI